MTDLDPRISILSTGLDSGSTRITDAFEELVLDVMVTLRAMLDEGTPEDRIAVAKMIGPLMAKMNGGGAGGAGSGDGGGVEEARAILAEMWDGL
jgi:hypothetical protein